MNDKLANLPTSELRRCPVQLRPVKKETVEYYMLRDSIRDVGIIQPILVRPSSEGYEVVCGNNRFECAQDLNLEEVPCVVRELSDEDVLRLQVIENSNQIETSPVDYIRRLQRIINLGIMTLEELAFHIHRHPDWVKKLLSINYLSPKCKEALDNRKISVKIGAELAKLKISEQDRLLDCYNDMSEREFLEIVRGVVRNERDAYKNLKRVKTEDIEPTFRTIRTVIDELKYRTYAATMLERAKAKTPLQGWVAAIEWVLSIDKQTLAERMDRKRRYIEAEARKNILRDLEMKERKKNNG